MNTFIFDFSRVILFPKDNDYVGSLNDLNKRLSEGSNYDPFDYFTINSELLEYLKNRLSGKNLYIFTTENIQERPEFTPYLTIFKKIYSAINLGLNKKDPSSYKFILEDLGKNPNDVVYIDDNSGNLKAAENTGIKTILYLDNEGLFRAIDKLLGVI